MAQYKKVGLAAYVVKDGKLFAACQKRGGLNQEKGFADESYRGAIQPLVHGGIEGEETPLQSLYREMGQEVGPEFRGVFDFTGNEKPFLSVDELQVLGGREDCVYYTTCLPVPESLERIHWHASTGGLVFISEEQLDEIINLRDFAKTDIIPAETLAMFPDDVALLRAGFGRYGKLLG